MNTINHPFLNLQKVIVFPNNVLDENKHLKTFLTYGRFSFNIEIKAWSRYFRHLLNVDKSGGIYVIYIYNL
jgi:hypothetical protein